MRLNIIHISLTSLESLKVEELKTSDFNLYQTKAILDKAIEFGHTPNYNKDIILDFTQKEMHSPYQIFCQRTDK